MLLGKPFRHFVDSELLEDRQQCKSALERYNDAAKTSSHISAEERGRFFRAIVDPTARQQYLQFRKVSDEGYNGPKGYIGQRTIVESPFNCEYGYNLHIGNDVIVQSGCYVQDACDVRIGDRTMIGPNVKFYGITASVDPTVRKGSHGPVNAGAIRIGDDCFIGGDVLIMPFRKIGNGAVVGAGSVVTKDVKENTVVAGNPAKFIRRIDPGSANADRHHDQDIQEQNEKMLNEMYELAKNGLDR
ncbi:trimeric LpxA-like protein [Teratosphaeria nubilosa]|uniref:Trimeric LpxA-like protein n=1 Tax=Teratosphaeria nubilosa TaxID=161662 RepID=A0A6G1LC23_9PEZI|nr:trimeric LpxA-like protein [Teratosphaeria nubilosa]